MLVSDRPQRRNQSGQNRQGSQQEARDLVDRCFQVWPVLLERTPPSLVIETAVKRIKAHIWSPVVPEESPNSISSNDPEHGCDENFELHRRGEALNVRRKGRLAARRKTSP
mgnify:CR=1 FL=1